MEPLGKVKNEDGSQVAVYQADEGVFVEETTQDGTKHGVSLMTPEEADMVIAALTKWRNR